MDPEPPWTKLASQLRFEDPFFRVDEDRVRDPAGAERSYGVVRFASRGVRILPVHSDGTVTLVRQYRYGAGYFSWELPAGNVEPGESDLEAAGRELREEIGHVAGSWCPLLAIVPSGSVTDERSALFAAWNLSSAGGQDLDETERIETRRVPFEEAVGMALAGRIGDAGTLVALLVARQKAADGALPVELCRILAGQRRSDAD